MTDQQHSAIAEDEELLTSDETITAADDSDDFDAMESDEASDPVARKTKISIPGPVPGAMGLLNVFGMIVVVAATVYGYLAATTGQFDPRVLFEQLRALDGRTLEMLYMVGGGLVVLGLIGSIILSRSMMPLRKAYAKREATLAAIADLDPEVEDGWMDESLRSHAGIDRFLTATLGAYRLLQSRLTKYVSLEGEMFRLEKAVSADQRVDTETTYDHAGAGRLAESLQKIWDEREAARRERDEALANADNAGERVAAVATEAVQWNCTTLDRVNLQAGQVEQLGRDGAGLARTLNEAAERQSVDGAGQEVLAQIRGELASLPNTDSSLALSAATGSIKDLVARGGKLAIQSAMEVARLGDRAGQLGGMSQELQDLITEFRAVATQLESLSGNQAKFSAVLTDTRRKLDSFNPGEGLGHRLEEAATGVDQLQAELGRAAAALLALAPEFNAQTERLEGLGAKGATPAQPVDIAAPEASPGMEKEDEDLGIESVDPFADSQPPASSVDAPLVNAASPFDTPDSDEPAEPLAGFDIESFANTPSAGLETDEAPDENLIGDPFEVPEQPPPPAESSEPGLIDLLKKATAAPEPEVEEPETPAATTETPAVEEEALPSTDEKVYDLSDFDAVPLAEGDMDDSSESERIYDLSEFGAVAVS